MSCVLSAEEKQEIVRTGVRLGKDHGREEEL